MKESFSVILLAIHRQDIDPVPTKNAFGRGHKNTMVNIDLSISEKRGKSLGMHPYRLVRFIENGEVELDACFSCCRSKLVAALIGCENNSRAIGTCAK